MIIAHVDFVGELEIDGRDAELGGLQRLLVDLVALGIFDFEEHVLVGDRLHVDGPQHQGANVHELARLVDRLVADEQDLGIGLETNVVFELFFAEQGFRGDFERVLAGLDAREVHLHVGPAVAVRAALARS